MRPGAPGGRSSGWADPVEHARMLHDDRRTSDYVAALSQAVRPGDVVLDIGTGSGVLAIAAARAGAKQVYAVEASDIAEAAERVFALNDMGDRITLVAAWSREIELPEPADLLVSEVIGNEPFEEEILETTLDARRRLLKPGRAADPERAHSLRTAPPAPRDGGEAARARTLGGRALARAVRDRLRAPGGRGGPGSRQLADRGRGGCGLAPRGSADHPRRPRPDCLRLGHGARRRRPRPRHARSRQRRRSHVPGRLARGDRAHTRSVEVADVELGDLGMGAARPAGRGAGRRAARPLQSPRPRNARRPQVRGCRARRRLRARTAPVTGGFALFG